MATDQHDHLGSGTAWLQPADPPAPRQWFSGFVKLPRHMPCSAAWCGLLAALLGACAQPPETPIQRAKVGDLLARAADATVELLVPFQPGVANGLYRGVIRVSPVKQGEQRLYQVNAVCSMKAEPDWPAYDNLYGDPLRNVSQKIVGASPQRWQVLYYFDGRIQGRGQLQPAAWMQRLKDNLCRRNDFDDAP